MKVEHLSVVVSAALVALMLDVRPGACWTTPAREAAGKPQACSQACLIKIMGDFKAADAIKAAEKYFARIPHGKSNPPEIVTTEMKQPAEAARLWQAVTRDYASSHWADSARQRLPVVQ